MNEAVRVRVAASPPLLDDLVRRALVGEGVVVTESSDCLVTVVTEDHVDQARTRAVLVLGTSMDGDVEIIIDEQHSAPCPLRSEHLRNLVIDIAHRLSPPAPAQG